MKHWLRRGPGSADSFLPALLRGRVLASVLAATAPSPSGRCEPILHARKALRACRCLRGREASAAGRRPRPSQRGDGAVAVEALDGPRHARTSKPRAVAAAGEAGVCFSGASARLRAPVTCWPGAGEWPAHGARSTHRKPASGRRPFRPASDARGAGETDPSFLCRSRPARPATARAQRGRKAAATSNRRAPEKFVIQLPDSAAHRLTPSIHAAWRALPPIAPQTCPQLRWIVRATRSGPRCQRKKVCAGLPDSAAVRLTASVGAAWRALPGDAPQSCPQFPWKDSGPPAN